MLICQKKPVEGIMDLWNSTALPTTALDGFMGLADIS